MKSLACYLLAVVQLAIIIPLVNKGHEWAWYLVGSGFVTFLIGAGIAHVTQTKK